MELMIPLVSRAGEPLYEQIYEYIKKEINTKDILGIYEVKKINEYYYITNFIKNENFKDE